MRHRWPMRNRDVTSTNALPGYQTRPAIRPAKSRCLITITVTTCVTAVSLEHSGGGCRHKVPFERVFELPGRDRRGLRRARGRPRPCLGVILRHTDQPGTAGHAATLRDLPAPPPGRRASADQPRSASRPTKPSWAASFRPRWPTGCGLPAPKPRGASGRPPISGRGRRSPANPCPRC